MIEYIIPENPDDRIINRAIDMMNSGGIICFPTDTNWVFAASTDSKKAIDALYSIKGVEKDKHFSMICNNISEASQYGIIYDGAFKLIRKVLPGPYTLIFEPTKELPRAIRGYRKEKEIGIRIPASILCQRLVQANGKPIITSSVTHDMLAENSNGLFLDQDSMIYSYQIEETYGHRLQMIIDPGDFEFHGDSSVINFATDDGIPAVIRAGAGDVSLFS